MNAKDYVIQAWMDDKLYSEILLTECSEDVLNVELETMRADYPGCETRIYRVNADVQGGTVNVTNYRRI